MVSDVFKIATFLNAKMYLNIFGVLIFSYFILIHQIDNFGGLRVAKLRGGSLLRVSSLAAALMARQ